MTASQGAVAGKVTVGLTSHWSRGMSTIRLSGLTRQMSPAYTPVGVRHPLPSPG